MPLANKMVHRMYRENSRKASRLADDENSQHDEIALAERHARRAKMIVCKEV